MSVFICAEAGVNHLGDRAKMLALCDAAKAAGADAVKFQAYDAMMLADRRGLLHHGQMVSLETGASDGGDWITPKREHQKTVDLLKAAELSDADLDAIAAHCKSIGLKWFASVFAPDQIERVLSRGACALKIGHAEADYAELVKACQSKTWHNNGSVPLYVSYPPSFDPEEAPLGIMPVMCVCEYPAKTPPKLWQIIGGGDQCWGDESRAFDGFSSHYTDYRIPAAAALRGAEYIEAHLKLGPRRHWPLEEQGYTIPQWIDDEPEAAWSLSPHDFAEMVKLIREYETWL